MNKLLIIMLTISTLTHAAQTKDECIKEVMREHVGTYEVDIHEADVICDSPILDSEEDYLASLDN